MFQSNKTGNKMNSKTSSILGPELEIHGDVNLTWVAFIVNSKLHYIAVYQIDLIPVIFIHRVSCWTIRIAYVLVQNSVTRYQYGCILVCIVCYRIANQRRQYTTTKNEKEGYRALFHVFPQNHSVIKLTYSKPASIQKSTTSALYFVVYLLHFVH